MTHCKMGSKAPGGEITINGRKHLVVTEHVTYEEICGWAGLKGAPSVTFSRGSEEKPEGILSPRGVIKVRNGMYFNVYHTGGA